MRVLIEDDDEDCRELLLDHIAPFGKCELATNGLEGLESVKQAYAAGDPFDFITLDMMMPELDGLSALKQIREYEDSQGIERNSGVKVMMISAVDDINKIRQSFNDQCEAYVVKPFDREKVLYGMKQLGIIGD